MNRFIVITVMFAFLGCSILCGSAGAISVVGSLHDLRKYDSSGGEGRVCIFCHTPHHATLLQDMQYTGPLWNRDENNVMANPSYYTSYVSSTIVASKGKPVGQPQGASRLCLSCHDGTIALASANTHGINVTIPPLSGNALLGTNLSTDHPVSIEYGLKTAEYVDAALVTGTTRVKLPKRDGVPNVECTSCHDPHDNQYSNFMVVNTAIQADALCTVCHAPINWTGSSHQATPGLLTKGCTSCHVPHKAQRAENLLKFGGAGGIDSNCTGSCHNGTAGRSIGIFTHGNNSDNPPGDKHKGAENEAITVDWGTDTLPLSQANKHVHCVDCHNPHQAMTSPATPPTPPAVDGVLKGVRGVDITGFPRIGSMPYAQYEYEVCFRCHSGNDAASGFFNNSVLPMIRIFNSWDEKERFNPSSALSWHPVAAPFTRVGDSMGLSLRDPAMKIIYCNDCHDPHDGTAHPHMLRKDSPDGFVVGLNPYNTLCYTCHDDNYLINNDSNVSRLHKAHVLPSHVSGNQYAAGCSACHDPHGVPNKPGLTNSNNALHLVNFDSRFAASATTSYNATAGSCFIGAVTGLTQQCHPTGTTRFISEYTP